MKKRETQYKRNPKLQRLFKKHLQAQVEWARRCLAWRKILRNNPSERALDKIADLLARLGFEPNELGIPRGDWPSITKTDPRVLLDAMSESIGKRPGDWGDRQNTLAWRADVLEAATLVWAGAIELDEKQVQDICPRALVGEVLMFLEYCDLETFWKRSGVGRTASDIREMWERGERVVDRDSLADMLRRAKGGT